MKIVALHRMQGPYQNEEKKYLFFLELILEEEAKMKNKDFLWFLIAKGIDISHPDEDTHLSLVTYTGETPQEVEEKAHAFVEQLKSFYKEWQDFKVICDSWFRRDREEFFLE